jgi:hypothetical protein
MIKTILVAANGVESDISVFRVALTLARPLNAHLDFYHVRITPDQSAALEPHVDFAQGRGLGEAMEGLQRDAETKSVMAMRLSRDFCEGNHILEAEPEAKALGVSAGWLEEKDDAVRRFLYRARRHDLVVVGRPLREQGLRRGLVE